MAKRNWKHIPTSLPEAIEACIAWALEKHRRTIDHIAADMGLANKWALYKWIESGRLPAILIRPFEAACRCKFVTSYLAYASHSLLIDIPKGKLQQVEDLQTVQQVTHKAMGALFGFAAQKVTADDALAALTEAMTALAWHRENVARHEQPELDLEESA